MIKTVDQHNLSQVLPLIAQYQKFYQAKEISDEKNKSFFSQFGENSPLGCQFAYFIDGQAVAFATVYFSFSSTLAEKVGVLNDVFTLPDYRGHGIARKLIDHCQQYAQNQGAARLQWVTATDNTTAQALYDKMDTKKSTWHFYAY